MAVVRICKSSNYVKNTGTDSELLPLAPAMFFVVPKTFSFTLEDLGENNADLLDFFQTAMHADRPNRIFPLFGNQVPIRNNTNTKGSDVTVTLDDGTPIFVQYGATSMLLATTDGGLCFQKILQSYNNVKMRVIMIDIQGNMLARDNKDGTYGGLIPASLFSPAPDLADFKNPGKSNFQISFNPIEYVNNAVMLGDASSLLDEIGLIDLEFVDAVATIAHIDVDIVDVCCNETVVGDIAGLTNALNFKITKKDDGTDAPITGITIVGGKLRIASTLVTTDVYTLSAHLPSVLVLHNVVGYEIIDSIDVTIP